MEIKKCAHCGGEAKIKRRPGFDYGSHIYSVECTCCKIKTDDFHADPFAQVDADKDAVDVWNSRVEQDGATIDSWFKEATEQRARAELAEMQRDELSEALEQSRRMLAYSGRLQ